MLEVSKQCFRSQGRKITQTDDMVRVVLDMSIIEYCNTIKKTKNGAIKQELTWISVKDSMPENGRLVDIYSPECGRVCDVKKLWKKEFLSENIDTIYTAATHWMYAPKKPKEGE